MPQFTIKVSSLLEDSRRSIWDAISSFEGINKEFVPLMTMTCPDPSLRMTADLVTDKPLFRSWILLFGLIPIDYDLIRLQEVEVYHGFKERSTMGFMSEWHHDRTLIDATSSNGTVVTDTLSFTPRIPFTGVILMFIVKQLFLLRHSNLTAKFGGVSNTCVM